MDSLKIRLQPKQVDLWNLWDDEIHGRLGFGGARGGAKSGGGRRCMLRRRLKYPNTTGIILRRTFNELYQSHIIKLFEEFPGIQEWYRGISKELKLPNGSRLFFGSAEHPGDMENFYSSEYADIMPDEAQEFSQSELEKLTGSNRCTSNSAIMPKMICTFMPGYSESGIPPRGLQYLKRVFVDGDYRGEETKQNWAFVQAFAWDNIEWARKELERDEISENEFYSWSAEDRRTYFITRTHFGATLAAITDKNLRDAWLYGKWDVFQGQYFSNFSYEKHVITPEEAKERIKPWHKRWMSGDWGFDHPHAVYWHVQDELGRVITYREQYGRQVGEPELGKIITDKSAGEKLVAFPFSWDAGKQSKRSPKQFPKSINQLLADSLGKGLPQPFPADASPGSRIAGWRLMYQLIDSGMWQITADCPKLIECIPSLVRSPENTEDVMKVDWSENGIGDDPADSARMGLQHMLGSVQKPKEQLIQEQAQLIDDPVSRFFFVHKQNANLKEAQRITKPRFVPSWQERASR